MAIGQSEYWEMRMLDGEKATAKTEKYNKQTGNVKKKWLDHFADDDSKQTKKIMIIFKNVHGVQQEKR